jgi:hypothetical protein
MMEQNYKKISLNHRKYNENFLQVENSAVDHLDMISQLKVNIRNFNPGGKHF